MSWGNTSDFSLSDAVPPMRHESFSDQALFGRPLDPGRVSADQIADVLDAVGPQQ